MHQTKLSVNREALKIVDRLRQNSDEYGVIVKETHSGTVLIDAGIEAKGGLQTGKIITEICLGGYGKARIFPSPYRDQILPCIFVYTSYPAISTLGSQFADWQIIQGDYAAIGSGPIRALARKNRELYEKIDYGDESEGTVMVLETSSEPPESAIQKIADECGVPLGKLTLILVPTASVAGSTQVSGRIVETGLHKLLMLGLDPKRVTNAYGTAPIAPIHPKFVVAMGRTNDAILYGGVAHYDVTGYTDDELREFVKKAPSSRSKSYGQPFQQIFKSAKYDFYKVDPNLFAPAVVSASNVGTGSVFSAGKVDLEVLSQSFGLRRQ